jgi:release factor glutamine methyltransferase
MSDQAQSNQVLTIAEALRLDDHRVAPSLNINKELHETNKLFDIRQLTQILEYVLGKNNAFIRTYPEFQLSVDQTYQFLNFRQQLQSGVPLAYVLGSQAFWTLDLKVTTETLIPRPDTEIVVVTILQLLPKNQPMNVMDMGTGSGAIALSLAMECPLWRITATDVSIGALAVATENAQTHGLHHVRFLQGNWFDALPKPKDRGSNAGETFDLIVSNPPYIDPDDVHLADLTHEPMTALVAQDQGLSDLKMIIHQSLDYLNEGGLLLLEHGYNQAERVRDLMQHAGFVDVRTVRDYGGHERATWGFLAVSTRSGCDDE